MKRILKSLLLALCLVAGLSATASAQSPVQSYDKFGTNAVGIIISAWNTIDSTIVDGSVVAIDTTSAIKRIGVRPYLPASIIRLRCVGIAVGDIPKSSLGAPGRVLIYGYHPRARIGASGVAAGASLKYSLSVANSFAQADSVSGAVGYILGGNSTVYPGVVYKYKVWFWGGRPQGAVTL